jgi:uncharacterized membrane protein
MTESSKKNRIIFIDLMRAFAVLQMVQGHTIDVLLSDQYRNLSNPIFSLWFFMRGMTAPIFLFTAGNVFMYLFRLVNEPFGKNPRVKKGIIRFFLLLVLGYLLRYPTPTLFYFSNVSLGQWKTFFAVDVLQLIAFGLLFLMIAAFIAEKLKISDYIVFTFFTLFFFILSIPFSKIDWLRIFPIALAGYFYNGSGSNFPLFPWAGYVIAGGILGSYLAKHPNIFKTAKFSLNLTFLGAMFIILSIIGHQVELAFNVKSDFWSNSPNLILYRMGIVLFLNSVVSFISLEVNSIPKFFILVGRNTLLIYIVHLMILYGSAWNPGIDLLFAKSFGAWGAIGSALVMITLMGIMVYLINKFKIRNKELVT